MKTFAVLGLGAFGRALATSLAKRGAEVIGIDSSPEIIEEIKNDISQAVCLDSTDARAMQEAGLEDVDVAVVAHGLQLDTNVLTTVIVRRLGVPTIVARAVSEIHAEVLRALGVDRVISVEQELGSQLADSLLAPEIIKQIPLASGHSLVEVMPREEFVGRTLRDIDPRANFGVNVVAVRRRHREITEEGDISFVEAIEATPDPDLKINEYDRLLLIGADEAIKAFSGGKRPDTDDTR